MIATALTERLGIDVPLIQAPMGGGPTTPALVAAVSGAGALGSLAGGYLSAARLRDEMREVRERTDRPFAVNVFAPGKPQFGDDEVERAQLLLEPYRAELGLPLRPEPVDLAPDRFADQLDVLLDEPPAVVSFTFGTLPADAVRALHRAGCVLIGTATSVQEAVALAGQGIDVVCAQGSEAGAHRGSFLTDPSCALVGTLALVPLVADAVSRSASGSERRHGSHEAVSRSASGSERRHGSHETGVASGSETGVAVVAAGGIMDGRGIAACLALGAAAAQLGTAFLRCPEAGTTAVHRRALAEADETSTVVTAALTGRSARGIANRLVRELHGADVPAYPAMNALTAELRRAAAEQGRADLTSLWAGQGVALGTDRPAAELVRWLTEDAERQIGRLAALAR